MQPVNCRVIGALSAEKEQEENEKKWSKAAGQKVCDHECIAISGDVCDSESTNCQTSICLSENSRLET